MDVWRRAARLSAAIYQDQNDSRKYGFKDQITRSGLSIASNIAEGYERATTRDRVKFLNYTKGSSGGLRTHIYIGVEAGYIDRERGMKRVRETREISRML